MTEKEKVLFYCNIPYELKHFSQFNYEILHNCPVDQQRGKHKEQMNECFIMFDTETSKSNADKFKVEGKRKIYETNENYIVAWTIAINIYGYNIVCLYGTRPDELIDTIIKINDSLPGTKTVFFCHNLSYDHVFIRRFAYAKMGIPIEQLNTKPHYPVDLTFMDGIHFRDSLILSQRSIERWAKDMHVKHQKAVGSWDYDKIRHQNGNFTEEEKLYIQNDVLAGVECLNALRKQLNKTYAGMPLTQTGIVRMEARKEGKKHQAHKEAVKYYSDLSFYDMEEELYHGGYTHANRHYIGDIAEGNIKCYDFASSYPYCILAEKFPVERFSELGYDLTPEEVLDSEECLIFRFRACGVRLRDPLDPFPVLQLSKARKVYNGIFDNGRILETDFIDMLCNEVDFKSIYSKYTWDNCWITNVYFAYKDFLPRWLTDFVYQLFRNKTLLKGGDPVLYAIYKGMLNSVYIRDDGSKNDKRRYKGKSRYGRIRNHDRKNGRKIPKKHKKAIYFFKLCMGYLCNILRAKEHFEYCF